MSPRAARCFCPHCGAELPAWFDPAAPLYDVSADDAAYQRWLETPCPSCGLAPNQRQNCGYLDIVLDGPPGSGRLVEIESPAGVSVRVGQWIDRGDGQWALRIRGEDVTKV